MVDLIFFIFLFLSGNFSPISPILQAPRIESVIACRTGSPSEWPNVPTDEGIFIPLKYNFFFGTNLWTSNPIPYLISLLDEISELTVILLFLISPLIILIFLPAEINKFASSVIFELWSFCSL